MSAYTVDTKSVKPMFLNVARIWLCMGGGGAGGWMGGGGGQSDHPLPRQVSTELKYLHCCCFRMPQETMCQFCLVEFHTVVVRPHSLDIRNLVE